MELKLPLVLERPGIGVVRCWLPHWPGIRGEGPSLSELKDDLSLQVMLAFEQDSPAEAWRWQLAPHLKLRPFELDFTARDQRDGRAYRLEGTVVVLLEKWPRDDFWVATPTTAPHLRFACATLEDVQAGLEHRLRAWCLEKRVPTLEFIASQKEQRLDLLEVDADAPTILPRRAVPLRMRRRKATPKPDEPKAETVESPEEREQRRTRARLSARTLRQIGRNLSHQARDGTLARAYGREAIVTSVVEAIEKRPGVAIALVGVGGVGKSAIAHEVTRRLVERQALRRRDVWRTDGNQFIAGMSYVGQWEARARELCAELAETGDVLFVDDLASLVFAGRHAKGDTHLAMYLEPSLARGELSLLGECTPERFERMREEAPSFAARFDVIQVPPMSERETIPVMLSAVRAVEASPGQRPARVPPDVLQVAMELSGRFQASRALPGRAVRLLHQVLAAPGIIHGGVRRYRPVDVFEAMRRETGLPDFVLGGATPKRRTEIRAELLTQVAGQPEAIEAVTDAVLALQQSLQDPDKPLANFLFVGPTGVGKTETAKALARYLFGSSERLVRFDMSELAAPGSVGRLIGSAGGDEGELLTALKTQPFCVVLFDEIEKAHPRVFDALLQFLGEGRLSDASGRTADGRNCVVVMTSNLGVREAATQSGFVQGDVQSASQHYLAAARAFFRPELFNRLDRIVPFRSLDRAALRVVVEHALGSLLRRRGLQRSNVLVDVEPELLELLVEQAFDPRYGARPLKRALERQLAVPLAHHLVRRASDDFALVELLRRGDSSALSVRLLAPAGPVAAPAPTSWTVPKLSQATRDAYALARSLEEGPGARALTSQRRAALSEGRSVPAGCELLDELGTLRARLEELLEGPLDPQLYEERVGAVPHSERDRGGRRNPWRAPKHNRPQPEVGGVLYAPNPEATVNAVAPVLAPALVELEILSARLAAANRPDEAVVLVLESVAMEASWAVEAFAASIAVVPARRLHQPSLGPWQADRPPAERRRALIFDGPGTRALLDPWLGYALVDGVDADGVSRRALVRAVPLKVADASEDTARAALTAWDAKAAAEREARRAGEEPAVDPFPVIVFEQRYGVPGRFVATGLLATESRAHLAACLRAKGGG
ncbi:MAG: AAA family ATPase [Myxococcaceae bacterium]|nr:AAA family ATPase [Myxococcaceae bacterium]